MHKTKYAIYWDKSINKWVHKKTVMAWSNNKKFINIMLYY
jgi:hypothetical protein